MFWVETASRVMRRQSHLGGVIYLEAAKVKNLISVPYYWNGVPKDQAYARYLSPLRVNEKNIGVPLLPFRNEFVLLRISFGVPCIY